MPDNKKITGREEMLKAVKKDGEALKYADDTLKADREVVLEAVKNYGTALQYASDSLKADRELVLEAINNNGWALEYADDSFKADRELVLEAVKNNGHACKIGFRADDSFKADRELVLEAIKEDGTLLKYADDSFKADRELVLEAVKNDDWMLKYASEELQNDPELIKFAGSVKKQAKSRSLPGSRKRIVVREGALTELKLKMTGMWEFSDPNYRCRYLIVWAELNSNEMAGAYCGFSGGGSFEWEAFYAQHSDKELTSLLIDLWDKVTGEGDYGGFNPPSAEAWEICSAAEVELGLWHDEDDWYDRDSLYLRPELIEDLEINEGGTLILDRDDHHYLLNAIFHHTGLTAGPDFRMF